MKGAGVQWCLTCRHRWNPCSPGCRGYTCNLHGTNGPVIEGCEGCGVPDVIARKWPEAWRAMAARLTGHKLDAVVDG